MRRLAQFFFLSLFFLPVILISFMFTSSNLVRYIFYNDLREGVIVSMEFFDGSNFSGDEGDISYFVQDFESDNLIEISFNKNSDSPLLFHMNKGDTVQLQRIHSSDGRIINWKGHEINSEVDGFNMIWTLITLIVLFGTLFFYTKNLLKIFR